MMVKKTNNTQKTKEIKFEANKISIPQISILKVELIINKQLFDDGVINEIQYYEISKIIYEKINQEINEKTNLIS